MSRFSAWAKQAEKAPKQAASLQPGVYLVDNRELKSKSRGLVYRNSARLHDKSSRIAEFGTLVKGVACEGNWLKVDSKYLPMTLDGLQVLLPKRAPADAEEPSGPRFEDLGHLPGWFTASIVKGQANEDDRQRARETDPGGQWYTVVSDVAIIRTHPRMDSTKENFKKKGDLIQLFDWDAMHEWRFYKDNLNTGWMRLEHPELGPLLKPMDNLLKAVYQNDLEGLRHCLANTKRKDLLTFGPGAVRCAAERGMLDFLVALAEGGASTKSLLAPGPNAPELSQEPAATQALAAALCGQDFDMQQFDRALELMSPEMRNVADRLLDQIAESHAARRQGTEEEEIEEEEAEEEEEQQVEPNEDAAPTRGDPAQLYVVTFKQVAIRAEPLLDSEVIERAVKGEYLNLLSYDATRCWRKHWAPRVKRYGWVTLSHPRLGDLLKPAGPPPPVAQDDEEEEPRRRHDGWDALFRR